jgi:TetR/AcrR family transcriptional regulator, regulator of cefoperazone and chloramphenicol sensitivity
METAHKNYIFEQEENLDQENNDASQNMRGDNTREALVQTAMQIFARDGYDAASTRNIANEAGVNQALISYHFRTKFGLYIAVFEHIVKIMQTRLGPKLEILRQLINQNNIDNEIIINALMAFSDNAIEILVSDEMTNKAKLILREQQSPTAAFDIVYRGFMEPLLNTLMTLIERLRPDLEGEELRLCVISFFGQVIAMRAARSAIMRFMNWQIIEQEETQKIKTQIRENFKTLIKYGGLA